MSIGKQSTATTIVNNQNTAKAVKSGSIDVFATPMMIALMEQAASDCLTDILQSGQTSVGTQINVTHKAASPLGAKISATATITHIDGRKVLFQVTAHDNVTEIGNGTHERFIIDQEKFLKKLEQR